MATSLTPGLAKAYRAGTHRLVSPQETVERVRPFMASMGITRIADVTGLDCIGVPVVMVVRPNSRSIAVSQGKGLDLWAAKASGLMESVEGYHAEYLTTLPLKYDSYAELSRTHRLADVAEMAREDPCLFHHDRPLLWIQGFDLLAEEPVWLPYELVHTIYTVDKTLCPGNFAASSNGLASGNHLLEAISHAICEVVERDATTLFFLLSEEERDRRRIDPDTVDDPGCREVLDKYEQAGVTVGVWESTTDVGLPCFECGIVDRESKGLRDLYSAGGSGCHPAREVALLRALTEAAQSRAACISGSRDDLFRTMYDRAMSPEAIDGLRQRLATGTPSRDFRKVPTWEGDTLDGDVAWELKRLQGIGIEHVFVVDLTKPEFGLPVARVIIPGLEAKGVVPNCRYGRRALAHMEVKQ
ncbi:MAG: YcaO-like family protein [Acidobacteriia bacterium]|nr:YcaO-like family protein [Terriglobia bacterium]